MMLRYRMCRVVVIVEYPCPSSPDAREPISFVNPFDHLRKKEAMVQKANVSHVKTKMGKLVRMRGLPCVRRSSPLYSGRMVRDAVITSLEKKKSKEEVRKK
jgi:hypothetical protein